MGKIPVTGRKKAPEKGGWKKGAIVGADGLVGGRRRFSFAEDAQRLTVDERGADLLVRAQHDAVEGLP